MIWKTIILLSFALSVLSEEHATSEQYFKVNHKDHHHGELSHIGSKEPEHHEKYASAYPSYEFSYKVHDPHTHDIKGQEEYRDGDKVKGEYWLIEPNGHKRTVKYHADKHSGFHAIVSYSDHHHDHEDKKEEEGKEEEAKKEKKEENVEKQNSKESKESHHDEGKKADEEGGEETRDGEESRGHEELGKWIHDRHWGYRAKNHYHENKHDQSDDNDYSHDHESMPLVNIASIGKHKHRAEHTGTDYGGRKGHKDWFRDFEKHQESRVRPMYRSINVHEYPEQKNKVVRENYVHPRLHRHSLSQLSKS